jgi:hypothetical protein
MNDVNIRELMSKVKCFLLDMDGTFYLGNQLLQGSLDFLDACERTGRRTLFFDQQFLQVCRALCAKAERHGRA